jgi:hypothetical protein
MIVTTFDLLLLVAVPAVVAVVGTFLWQLAVRRVVRHEGASAPAPAVSSTWEPQHSSSAAPAGVLVHTSGDTGPLSPRPSR